VLERRILEEQGNKSMINPMNNSKLQLNRDINYILHGREIRKYGEMPKYLGGFERIAPSENYERVLKVVQNYKTTHVRGTID
jgi:tubulin polyglutamylase TTLL5